MQYVIVHYINKIMIILACVVVCYEISYTCRTAEAASRIRSDLIRNQEFSDNLFNVYDIFLGAKHVKMGCALSRRSNSTKFDRWAGISLFNNHFMTVMTFESASKSGFQDVEISIGDTKVVRRRLVKDHSSVYFFHPDDLSMLRSKEVMTSNNNINVYLLHSGDFNLIDKYLEPCIQK